jgi:hypothetical protein
VIQDIEGEQQSNRLYKGIIAIDRLKLLPVKKKVNICRRTL